MAVDMTLNLYRDTFSNRLKGSFNPNDPINHGNSYSIVVTGAGSKADNNNADYLFYGRRHSHYRFTDFEDTIAQTPVSNTKAGWQAHLNGVYPIVTSTDFNSAATASGATLQLSGSPTPSGKWLRRRITQAVADLYPSNYRLRNFNLCDNVNEGNTAKGQVYVSYYLLPTVTTEVGKEFRIYFQQGADPTYSIWKNYVVSNNAHNWRLEWAGSGGGGELGGFSDQNIPPTSGYLLVELLLDFTNNRYAFIVNGTTLTDTSNGYNGWIAGQLDPANIVKYALLGNTVEQHDDTHHVGWAMPTMDYSMKRIYLADNAVWASKTLPPVLQPTTDWVNNGATSDINFVINKGHFPDLVGKHIFYADGLTVSYVGALV